MARVPQTAPETLACLRHELARFRELRRILVNKIGLHRDRIDQTKIELAGVEAEIEKIEAVLAMRNVEAVR